MYLVDLLFAFVIALLLTSLLVPLGGFRRRTAGETGAGILLFLFCALFFTTWAGGLWVAPFGPTLLGRSWLPFLLVGGFVALLLAAATVPPARYRRLDYERRGGAEETVVEIAFFGITFWMLIAAAIAVIAFAYTGTT